MPPSTSSRRRLGVTLFGFGCPTTHSCARILPRGRRVLRVDHCRAPKSVRPNFKTDRFQTGFGPILPASTELCSGSFACFACFVVRSFLVGFLSSFVTGNSPFQRCHPRARAGRWCHWVPKRAKRCQKVTFGRFQQFPIVSLGIIGYSPATSFNAQWQVWQVFGTFLKPAKTCQNLPSATSAWGKASRPSSPVPVPATKF